MTLSRIQFAAPTSTPTTPDVDEEEEQDACWETDAQDSVASLIASLEFDEEQGVARFRTEEGWVVLEDLEELRDCLQEAYAEGWSASVPFDGGEAVFDGDPTDTVEDAITSIEDKLKALGWEV